MGEHDGLGPRLLLHGEARVGATDVAEQDRELEHGRRLASGAITLPGYSAAAAPVDGLSVSHTTPGRVASRASDVGAS